jgi:hypothetical protein
MRQPSESAARTSEAPGSPPPRLTPILAGMTCGALALVLYLASNDPLVSHEDVAEFQTLAATGGIAHAGYPAYVALLQLAGHLPFGTYAFKANLLSCVAGAFASGLAAYGGAVLCSSPIAGLLGGIVFALSFTAWRESSHAEVYSFTLALNAALFLLAIRLDRRLSAPTVFAGSLLFGLGLVSHLVTLALLPVILFVLVRAWRAGSWSRATTMGAIVGLLCGLSPTLYLLQMDRPGQPMNYIEDTLDPASGRYVDPREMPRGRLERAAWLLSTRQYLAGGWFHPFKETGQRLRSLVVHLLVNDFPGVGLAVAGVGLLGLLARGSPGLAGMLLWMMGTIFWLLFGAVPMVVTQFFLPGVWLLSLCVAAGVAVFSNRSRSRLTLAAALLLLGPVMRLSAAEPPAALEGHPLVVAAWSQWPERWHPFHRDARWDRYGRQVMAEVAPRAIVMTCWDEGTTLRYFRYAEKLRVDVDVAMTCWEPTRVRNLVQAADSAARPVYVTFHPGRAGLGVDQWRAVGPTQPAELWQRIGTEPANRAPD